jgi:hypothetical protein
MAISKMLVLPLIASDLKAFVADRQFRTVLADPPWRFANRTGKMAPEHRGISVNLPECGRFPILGKTHL